MSSFGLDLYSPKVPMNGFVRFKLGDLLFEGETPNFIKSFSFNKKPGDRGEFEIVLSDVLDFELEAKIIDSVSKRENNISFQYGYSEGRVSSWYRGMVLNYETEFLRNMNANFTIKGIADMSLGKMLNRTFYLKDFDYRYSNLIKYLVKEEGWKVGNPFINSDKVTEEEVSVVNKNTLSFIRELVLRTKREGVGTKFYHFCSSDGVTVILTEYDDMTKLIKKEFNFVINSGNYGSVLSFTPSYNAWANMLSKVEAGYIDRVTNQFTLFKNAPNLGKNDPTINLYFGADSVEDFNNNIESHWRETRLENFGTASMEVVGDPDFEPLQYLNILPIRPDGRLHHSAGTYFIKTVRDEISSGYRTSLELVKNPGKKSDMNSAYKSGGWG
jgi:hypothetical protein